MASLMGEFCQASLIAPVLPSRSHRYAALLSASISIIAVLQPDPVNPADRHFSASYHIGPITRPRRRQLSLKPAFREGFMAADKIV